MIHRDYILRMIEEFLRILSSILFLKQSRRWQELEGTLDEQFQRLVCANAAEAVRLSETELTAKLTRGESTHLVQHKTRFLIRLFKEAGDAALAQERPEQARAFLLKGLELLFLDTELDVTFNPPDYLPRIEAFIEALSNEPLPVRIQALLMRHYERAGLFAKAEDTFYSILESLPDNAETIDFGIAFYDRLLAHSDAALLAGNLPRPELQSALAELKARRAALS